MVSETAQSKAFRLGRIVFQVNNCNEQFVRNLELLLPRVDSADVAEGDIYQAQTGCIQIEDFKLLLNHILKRHQGCFWMDAACVVSPGGAKILIAGKSGAGKSTTSMALAFGYGWKVAAEDLALVDPKTDELIRFGSPFSLKPGTKELLLETIGTIPAPLIMDEYAALGDHGVASDLKLPFDYALLLANTRQPLELKPITAGEFVRHLLPYSNLLRTTDGVDRFVDYLTPARCIMVAGGTLSERLHAIVALDGQ